MKALAAFFLTVTVFLSAHVAGARDLPPGAVEFPLNDAAGQGEQATQTRGQGERSDRWIGGNYASNLTVTLPADGVKPTAAVVVCPGGGYGGLSYDKEGTFIAKWMNDRGVAAGVLKYRTGGGAHQHPAPQDDVQLALQTMRASADRFGYPADKIGVMGFSAGGHLAATAATQHDPGQPQRGDASPAAFSSRPDFAVLIYPVISLEHGITHGGSRNNLLGPEASDEQAAAMSADLNVSEETPPSLLVHASDDRAVPVANSIRYYEACVKHNVPAELHVYEEGGHGFGMWRDGLPVEQWPATLEAWMARHGWIEAGQK